MPRMLTDVRPPVIEDAVAHVMLEPGQTTDVTSLFTALHWLNVHREIARVSLDCSEATIVIMNLNSTIATFGGPWMKDGQDCELVIGAGLDATVRVTNRHPDKTIILQVCMRVLLPGR